MSDPLGGPTRRAVGFNADGGSDEYYRRLADGQWASTRCQACGQLALPPRPFCPACGADDVAWVELPAEVELYAFTQQQRSLRFMAPDVLGLVEVEPGALVLARIEAPFEALAIGQRLAFARVEVAAGLWLPQFRPLAAG